MDAIKDRGLDVGYYNKAYDELVTKRKIFDEPGGINFFKEAKKRFEGKNKDSDARYNFEVSLDWMMKKEGLSPKDPKVGELAKKLEEELDSSETWWDITPFEELAEEKPWLTGETETRTTMLMSAEALGASMEEIQAVVDILRADGQATTEQNKEKMLKALRKRDPAIINVIKNKNIESAKEWAN